MDVVFGKTNKTNGIISLNENSNDRKAKSRENFAGFFAAFHPLNDLTTGDNSPGKNTQLDSAGIAETLKPHYNEKMNEATENESGSSQNIFALNFVPIVFASNLSNQSFNISAMQEPTASEEAAIIKIDPNLVVGSNSNNGDFFQVNSTETGETVLRNFLLAEEMQVEASLPAENAFLENVSPKSELVNVNSNEQQLFLSMLSEQTGDNAENVSQYISLPQQADQAVQHKIENLLATIMERNEKTEEGKHDLKNIRVNNENLSQQATTLLKEDFNQIAHYEQNYCVTQMEDKLLENSGLSETLFLKDDRNGEAVEFQNIQATERTEHFLQKEEEYKILNQIVKKIYIANGSRQQEIHVELKPEHLGDLKFKLSVHNGHLEGKFLADNPQVREVLETNLNLLKRHLEEQGIQVYRLSVGLGNSYAHTNSRRESFPSRKILQSITDRITQEYDGEIEGADKISSLYGSRISYLV